MIKVTGAKAMRDAAFEATVTTAGEVLRQELAAAGGDREARRAAWSRYGDVQDKAGAAYRAAQAAEAVRARPCPLCDTPAGQPCQPKPAADHLARWLDSYTAGRLTRQYMAMVLGELVVIDVCVVVAIPAQPNGPDGFGCDCGTRLPWPSRTEDMTCPACGTAWEHDGVDIGGGARIKVPESGPLSTGCPSCGAPAGAACTGSFPCVSRDYAARGELGGAR